jgi:hypothetical protein
MKNKTLLGYYAFQLKASSRKPQQTNVSLAIYNKLKIFPTFLTLKILHTRVDVAGGGAPRPPRSPCPASIRAPGPVPPPDFITTYVFKALAISEPNLYPYATTK